MDDALLNQEFKIIAAIENGEIKDEELKQLAKFYVANNFQLFRQNQLLILDLLKAQQLLNKPQVLWLSY